MAKVKSMVVSIEERFKKALVPGKTTSVTREQALQLCKDTVGMLDRGLGIMSNEDSLKYEYEAIEKLNNVELVVALIELDKIYKKALKDNRLSNISKLVS